MQSFIIESELKVPGERGQFISIRCVGLLGGWGGCTKVRDIKHIRAQTSGEKSQFLGWLGYTRESGWVYQNQNIHRIDKKLTIPFF